MNKKNIKELYSIDSKNGVLIIVKRDIDDLTQGYYLKTSGYIDTQITSNYRIVGYNLNIDKRKDLKPPLLNGY